MNSVKKGKDPTQGHKKVVLPEDRPGIQDKDANKQIKKEAKKPNKKSSGGLFSFGKSKRSSGPKRKPGPKRSTPAKVKAKKTKEIMDDDFSDTTMIDAKEVHAALDKQDEAKRPNTLDVDSTEEKVPKEVKEPKSKPITREVVTNDSIESSEDSNLVVSIIRDDIVDKDVKPDRLLMALAKSAKSLSIVPFTVDVDPVSDYLDLVFDIEDNKRYNNFEDVNLDIQVDDDEDEVYAEPSVVETRKISNDDRESVRAKASNFQQSPVSRDSSRGRNLSDRRENPRARSRQRGRGRQIGTEDLVVK